MKRFVNDYEPFAWLEPSEFGDFILRYVPYTPKEVLTFHTIWLTASPKGTRRAA